MGTRKTKASETNALQNVILVDKDVFASLLAQQAALLAATQSGQLQNQTGNQLTNAAASVATNDALMKLLTSSRSDDDIGETETWRAALPLNMKKILATELAALQSFISQSNAQSWNVIHQAAVMNLNAINTSNIVNSGLAESFLKTIGANGHGHRNLMAQPFLYTENAPAAQDTPGEGTDPGLTVSGSTKGGTKGGRRVVASTRATRAR